MVYLVTIEERLSRSYLVNANTSDEAEDFITRKYRDTGEIVLTADDFVEGTVCASPEFRASEKECDFAVNDRWQPEGSDKGVGK